MTEPRITQLGSGKLLAHPADFLCARIDDTPNVIIFQRNMPRHAALSRSRHIAMPADHQLQPGVFSSFYMTLGTARPTLRMSGDWDEYFAFHKRSERLRSYPEHDTLVQRAA